MLFLSYVGHTLRDGAIHMAQGSLPARSSQSPLSQRLVPLLIGLACLFFGASAYAGPTLSLGAYQALGVDSKLPTILESLRDAYQKRTGEAATSLSQIDQAFGRYGLKRLGACAQKIACFVSITKSRLPSAKQALYLGVGSIGKRLLVQLSLIDLESGKLITRKNVSYSGMDDFKQKAPALLAALFPNYALLQVSGSPSKADVFISGRKRDTIPTNKMPVPSGTPFEVKITAPGYEPWTQQLSVQKGETKSLFAKLKKKGERVAVVRRKPPERGKRPLPPKATPGTPFYATWWFWTVAGVVVVGGVAAGVGIAASQAAAPQELQLPFL